MNEKYKEYLKDLPPELQEKAKDIKTQEELLEFLSDNDVELPEDALDAVSGGGFMDFLTLTKAIRDALDENN